MNNIYETTNLLSRWLKNKIGSSKIEDLNTEEMESYNQLKSSLLGHDLTDNDVYTFWVDYEEEIKNNIIDEKITDKYKDQCIVELRLIKKVRAFLNGPKTQAHNVKVMLEKSLINN